MGRKKKTETQQPNALMRDFTTQSAPVAGAGTSAAAGGAGPSAEANRPGAPRPQSQARAQPQATQPQASQLDRLAANAQRSLRAEAAATWQEELAAARAAVAARGPPPSVLNDEQLAAAHAPITLPLLAVAGAGTGKTTMIIERARHMILREGVDPRHLLLISFTNKAAKEAAQRLARLGVPGADRVAVCTFHSFCFSVLRRHFRAAGFARCPAVIADEAELKRVVAGCMVWLRLEQRKEALCAWLRLPLLETSWQALVDEVRATEPQLYGRAAVEAAARIQQELDAANAKKKKKTAKKAGGGGAGEPAAAAAAAAGGAGRKRKKAAEAAAPPAARSPLKQSKLTFTSSRGPAAPSPLPPLQPEPEPAPPEPPADDPSTLAAAGRLDAMPLRLQIALLARLYAALCDRHDPEQRAALRAVGEVDLLAPPPAKDVKQRWAALEGAKRRGLRPGDLAGYDRALRETYQLEMQRRCAVDFNDLIDKVRRGGAGGGC
jgi:hypothetical protein